MRFTQIVTQILNIYTTSVLMEFVSLTLYRQATVPHLLIVVSIIVAGSVALWPKQTAAV